MDQALGFDDGIHLRGSPVWVDAGRARSHCVVTKVGTRPLSAHERVLLPRRLQRFEACVSRVGSILPSPCDRWLGFGGQRFRFVSVGRRNSVALLLISNGERYLVLPSAGVDVVESDPGVHLLSPAPPIGFRGASLGRTIDALLNFIRTAAYERVPVRIQVDDAELALELVRQLDEMGESPRRVGWLAKLDCSGPGHASATIGVDGSIAKAARLAVVESRPVRRTVGDSRAVTFRIDWHGSYEKLTQCARVMQAKSVTVFGESGTGPGKWPGDLPLNLVRTRRQLEFRREVRIPGILSKVTN